MLDRIDLLILDVDGVLTDGRIIYDSRGADVKAFNVLDGQGVKYWLRVGHEAAILSGRASRTIRIRAGDIGIEAVYENAKDKLPVLEKILKRFGRAADRACYIGDDLVDLPVMARVGFAVATAGAAPEARRMAHYVTRSGGGAGAVRETIELILRYQGRWGDVLNRYTDQLPDDLPALRRPRKEQP
ncbi:MAG: phenylphosphate carboxylase subunit delta [Planctomycetes bacterium]|nr:phenylphosphate carboxylase subunit delta [Planctomycetota bacterium]